MKVTLKQVYRDYLALAGESPDLLPELGLGEGSAVLQLVDEVGVRLPEAALRATMETAAISADGLREHMPALLVGTGRYAIARMPDDYLRLHSLRMRDWREPLTETEPLESLRARLGGGAPAWMFCPRHPMVLEARDTEGVYLKIYGSRQLDVPAELLYVCTPKIDGDQLEIAASAYHRMLEILQIQRS